MRQFDSLPSSLERMFQPIIMNRLSKVNHRISIIRCHSQSWTYLTFADAEPSEYFDAGFGIPPFLLFFLWSVAPPQPPRVHLLCVETAKRIGTNVRRDSGVVSFHLPSSYYPGRPLPLSDCAAGWIFRRRSCFCLCLTTTS